MRKQGVKGDAVPGSRSSRSLRDVPLDRVFDTQLAALFKQQDRGGRELLADRGQAELSCRRVRDVPFQIGHPVAFGERTSLPRATSTDPMKVFCSSEKNRTT